MKDNLSLSPFSLQICLSGKNQSINQYIKARFPLGLSSSVPWSCLYTVNGEIYALDWMSDQDEGLHPLAAASRSWQEVKESSTTVSKKSTGAWRGVARKVLAAPRVWVLSSGYFSLASLQDTHLMHRTHFSVLAVEPFSILFLGMEVLHC